jgi:hypothetical protein
MRSTDLEPRDQSRTFRTEIFNRFQVSDFALILTVPLVLAAVHLLPASVQQSFMLEYQDPSAFNLWSAAFVHRGFTHFSGNAVAYCLYILPSYLLFVLAGERRIFRYLFLSFLLILPPVLAAINIVALDGGTGAGFSGIASAFIGLTPVGIFIFVRNCVSQDVSVSNGVSVFLIALGGTAYIYAGIVEAATILVVACLLVLNDIRSLSVETLRTIVSDLWIMDSCFLLVVIATTLFVLSPIFLFPVNIVQGGQSVNILSHYSGLVLGFFGPTTAILLRDKYYLRL